jgi:hypothetical protein
VDFLLHLWLALLYRERTAPAGHGSQDKACINDGNEHASYASGRRYTKSM